MPLTLWDMPKDEHGEKRFGAAAQCRRVGRKVQRARRREVERPPERPAPRRGRGPLAWPSARRRLRRGRRRDLARSERLDGHSDRHLRGGGWPGAGGSRTGRRSSRVDLRGRPPDSRSRPAHSTSSRCSIRRCPRRLARSPCGRLLDTVRPGGLLLAVYHDLDDEHREHMKSRGVDPADYVDADDLDSCSATTSRLSYMRSSRASTRRRTTRISPMSSCVPDAADNVAHRPSPP